MMGDMRISEWWVIDNKYGSVLCSAVRDARGRASRLSMR